MIRIQRAIRRAARRSCCSRVHKIRTLASQATPAVEETHVTEVSSPKKTVAYPEIVSVTPRAIYRRQQEAYFDKIKKLGTVEEKLIALNLPKYYGWPSFILKENVVPYNYLPFAQFITRTVISEDHLLPTCLPKDSIDRLKELLKRELEKVILFQESSHRFRYELERLYKEEEDLPFYDAEKINDLKTRLLIKQVNNAIVRVLASEHPHLISTQLDLDPRVEAFWRVGGFYSTEQDRKLRREKKIDESMIKDPIDRFIQYFSSPILQLRSKDPLQLVPTISLNTSEAKTEMITDGTSNEPTQVMVEDDKRPAEMLSKYLKLYPLQEYRYSPDLYLEISRERCHGAVVPGFWPNDRFRFGLVSYHSTSHCVNRPTHYGSQDFVEALHSQAILASYAWAYGQACYQGFTTYNDITYPFVTQAVLTDGKIFSFYQYQLNTVVLHSDNNEPENPLRNECYATPPTELYSEVDSDGVKGWNDEALINLINIYTKGRRNATEMDLSPYLEKDSRLISHISEEKRRKWLYDRHRTLMSHRPRHKLAPEIYDWERIYKIEHQKRITDARKRFFEKFEDPINDRKLNEHQTEYVPKVFRKPHRKRGRFAEAFYPDAFPEYPEIV